MPAVEPKYGDNSEMVLVTGANGYIAMWVTRTLLEKGYAVRGAVRSVEKGERLKEQFSSWGKKFEWIVVEDITKVQSGPTLSLSLI
jgi:nucleoside-diphosphate-sugar epimerase